jgi:rhomboid protease GluP
MSPLRSIFVKAGRGTTGLVAVLALVFGLELSTHSVGDESALLKLGALPDNGQLHGEYWRFATYSFLHFNWAHLLTNALLLLWIGRIIEGRIGLAKFGMIYVGSVLASATVILLFHNWYPKAGATVGASGAVFGLFGAALVISYRGDALSFGQEDRLRIWLWVALLAGLGISFLPGISMAGHVGGFLGGTLLGWISKGRRNS